MIRLSSVVERVLTLLGSEASLTTDEIESLIQTRYEHIYETRGWSKRLKDFGISLVAEISSDATTLVNVTQGSAVVTSIGTPFTSAMSGRQIEIGDLRQYFFVNYVSSSSLTIQDGEGQDVQWLGDNAVNQSWRLYKTIYTLPKDAEEVLSLVGDAPIEELDGGRARLDTIDPQRSTTNDHPTYWLYAGADRRLGTREIEVWPVPTMNRFLRGQYNRRAPELSPDTILDLPTPLLVFATAADACHLLHAKQGSEETMWENKALFFERKAGEVQKDYAIRDLELTSPPNHLERSSMDKQSQLAGTDWEVTHQLESP